MEKTRIVWLAWILFWLAALGASILAIMPQPPRLPTDDLGDKFNHVLAFSVMAALAAAAWPHTPRMRIVERLSFLGAIIEVFQSIPALHRDCDVRDWLADTAAVLVVTGIAALLSRRRASGPGQ